MFQEALTEVQVTALPVCAKPRASRRRSGTRHGRQDLLVFGDTRGATCAVRETQGSAASLGLRATLTGPPPTTPPRRSHNMQKLGTNRFPILARAASGAPVARALALMQSALWSRVVCGDTRPSRHAQWRGTCRTPPGAPPRASRVTAMNPQQLGSCPTASAARNGNRTQSSVSVKHHEFAVAVVVGSVFVAR